MHRSKERDSRRGQPTNQDKRNKKPRKSRPGEGMSLSSTNPASLVKHFVLLGNAMRIKYQRYMLCSETEQLAGGVRRGGGGALVGLLFRGLVALSWDGRTWDCFVSDILEGTYDDREEGGGEALE